MRPVLLDVVALVETFFRRPDDSRVWADAHVQPLRARWAPLSRVAFRDYTEPGANEGIVLSQALNSMRRWTVRADGSLEVGMTPDNARALQFQAAQRAEEAAKVLLDLMNP